MRIPSIFISHGAPTIVMEASPARDYLASLGEQIDRPKAIVVMSAHFEASGPTVVADPAPEMIYDFGGFPDEMYRMVYPAPGEPALARRVAGMMEQAGLKTTVLDKRGFDHGTWTPMMLAYPDAEVPIVQIAVDPNRDANYHYEIGKALAPLAEEGILLVGTGHITHNLRAVFSIMRSGEAADPEMVKKVDAFTGWFAEKFSENDTRAILNWKEHAPFAAENHPTDEHLMPLFFAYGAGGENPDAVRAHHSVQFEFFTYESWMFGQAA